MKRELERVDDPRRARRRERAWSVVEAAFTERAPVSRPSHWPRVAAVALAVGALVAATLSSPGRAVLDEIREVVGVERAQPALFSLPAPGRLLVASDAGVWVVSEDGSRRLLGDYREATWSPFGRFVAATRDERARGARAGRQTSAGRSPGPGVESPRWAGSGDRHADRLSSSRTRHSRRRRRRHERSSLGSRRPSGRSPGCPGASSRLAHRAARRRRSLSSTPTPDASSGVRDPPVRSPISNGRRTAASSRPGFVARRPTTSSSTGKTACRSRVSAFPRGSVTAAAARPGSHAPRCGDHARAADSRLSVTDARNALLSGPGRIRRTSRGRPTAAGCSSPGRRRTSGSSSAAARASAHPRRLEHRTAVPFRLVPARRGLVLRA